MREFPLAMVKMHLGDFKKRREEMEKFISYSFGYIKLVEVGDIKWRKEMLVFSSWFPNFFPNLTYF